jgi:hypothetical protein
MPALSERLRSLQTGRFSIALLLLGTILALGSLVVQRGATAAGSGPVPGIAVHRYGTTYPSASGYDRYSYVTVGVGDAAAAGALPTKSLVYMSGTTVQTGWNTGVSYQEALANNWLLKDANGQYVMNVGYNGYVGDIGNPAYQQRFLDNVAAFLSKNGNEGVFIDDVLMTPEAMTQGHWPAKYPTQQAWADATVSFMAKVGPGLKARGFYVEANAGSYVPGNPGNTDGSLAASWMRRLAPYVNGLMCEYWVQLSSDTSKLRPSGTSSWTQYWDGWADLVNVTQNAGADFFGLLEGSSSSVNTMRYGKASFLLEWNGSGGAFVYHMDADPWNPEWTMDIGQPSGGKYQVGAGWRREYTNGTVILNPSPSASQTFSLGGTYKRADGTAVTSVTLQPTTALILSKDSTSTTPPPAAPAPAPAPTSPPPPTTTTSSAYLSDLSWTSATNGWGPVEKDRASGENASGDGGTLTLNGTTYAKGLGVHAASDVRFNLGGNCSKFTANVGVDDEVGANGSVGFQVYADSSKVFDSGVMTGASATKPVDVSVAGASELRLIVGNGGDNINYDHGDWAAARIECGSSTTTPPPTSPPPPAAPVNSSVPTISGTAQAGLSLSASTGSWSNSPTGYGYQWRRCDTAGASCTSVAGATGAQYGLSTTDVGSTLRIVVTATNAGGSASATSSPSSVVAPAPTAPQPPSGAPPANIALPVISGTAEEGKALSASTGTWINAPTGYSFQWRRCDSSGGSCASIGGATATQYTLGSLDVGRTLRVLVTALNGAGQSTATSAASAFVAPKPAPPPPPVNVTPPDLSGPTSMGKRLRTSDGTWTNTPTRMTYQWKRCTSSSTCETIAGATDSTYALNPGDVGYRIVAVVTAWNAGGSCAAASVLSTSVRVGQGAGTN